MAVAEEFLHRDDGGFAFQEPGDTGMMEFVEGCVFFDLGFGCDGLEPSEQMHGGRWMSRR